MKGLNDLGVPTEKITQLWNLSKRAMSEKLREIGELIEKRWTEEGRHTFLYIYFGGHGVIDKGRL